MKVIDKGHKYSLDTLDGETEVIITFVKRLIVEGRTDSYPGTICQEVLRVLIDRVNVLNSELPHIVNEEIIQHLRMALVLFECRALERKVEKGSLKVEKVLTNPSDGHFTLVMD